MCRGSCALTHTLGCNNILPHVGVWLCPVYCKGCGRPREQTGRWQAPRLLYVGIKQKFYTVIGCFGRYSVFHMVSFIILNFKNGDLTHQCIASIKKTVKSGYEIIVVDNNSSQKEFNLLQKDIPKEVCLIRSKTNGGFGAGNMLGANFAKGDFLCFLNNDVVLTEDCVTPLCAYLTENPKVGCIIPQQYNGQNTLVPSFNHLNGIRQEIFKNKICEKLFPKKYPNRYHLTVPTIVGRIEGCFMLFPSNVFWNIGGFDTNIFLYCEEWDIACRLHSHGYSCVVHPLYRFTHLGGASTHKTTKSGMLYREMYISRLYVYRKHHNLFMSWIYCSIKALKILINPRRWYLLPIALGGEALSLSMKHKV